MTVDSIGLRHLPTGAAVSVLLPLDGPRDRPPPDANLLRRGVLRVLREGGEENPRSHEVAEAFHDDPGEAGHPWAVSPPFRHAGRCLFRLTAVGVATATELADAIAPGSRMVPDHWRIGRLDDWRVTAVDTGAFAGQPQHRGPWRLGVALISPTAVSGTRRGTYGVLNAPGLVDIWRRRWVAHLGGDHPVAAIVDPPRRGMRDPFGEWLRDEVVFADGALRLALCRSPHDRHQPIPVTAGTVVLKLPAGWTLAHAALRALWQWSFFCGSGRHLTVGFGQTLPFDVSSPFDALRPKLFGEMPRPALAGGRVRELLVERHGHTLPLGRAGGYR